MALKTLDYLLPTLMGIGQIGSSLYESGQNKRLQQTQNEEDRAFQERMYRIQRGDALADRQYMEEYNNPTNVIGRMKAAGLNPALLYANSGPVGTTEMPRQSQPSGSSQPAPKIDQQGLRTALASFQTNIGQAAQVNNMEAQNELLQQQVKLAMAQTAKTLGETDTNKFNLGIQEELRDTTIAKGRLETDKLALENKKTAQDIQIDFDQNERAKLKNSTDISKTLEEIRSMRQQRLFELQKQPGALHMQDAQIKKLELEMSELDEQIQMLNTANKYRDRNEKLDQLLKEYETIMTMLGVRPNDGALMRQAKLVAAKISGLLETIQEGFKKVPQNK